MPLRSRYYLTKTACKIVVGGVATFAFYEYFNGNEEFHKGHAMPIAHCLLSPERAHRTAIFMAKHNFMPWRGSMYDEYDELKTKVFDRNFRNPIGLAAGFDKSGEAVSGLSNSGFGFIEIGTVTPHAQPGNPKPRVYRVLHEKAVINSYGFNNEGHAAVVDRLKKARRSMDEKVADKLKTSCLVGVNLGKNKTSTDANADYSQGYMTFVRYADYIVVNVSSPNTPGLRDMQHKNELKNLLTTMKKTRMNFDEESQKVPLLLKISPDLSPEEMADIAALCVDKSNGVDGLIVTNTTITRPDHFIETFKHLPGGLSGPPLKELSTKCVKEFRKLTKGRIPIIASGGVSSGEDAYEKIRAGASLVQLYTSLVYQGFPVIGRVKRELVECLKRDGFSNVAEAVGVDCPV